MPQSCNPKFMDIARPSTIASERAVGHSVAEWNRTKTEYPYVPGLQRFVEEQVARTPHAIAAESISEAACLTYSDLNSRANQLAHHLTKHGIGPDSVVGICSMRSLDLMIAVLAVTKAGAAYVPFDPAYPQDRLSFMLEDTNAPVILTQEALAKNLPRRNARIFCLDTDWKTVAREKAENPPCRVHHDNLAYLIYTSGSTGKPKGVAMRHGPLINLLQWQLENWSSRRDARTLQFASINFDVSFQEIFSTWASGGTVVLISEEERRDSNALIHFIEKHRVERLFLPFVALKHLADAAEREQVYPSCLKEVITAGEQLQSTPQIVNFFSRLPACTLENQYGPSETHVVTAYRLGKDAKQWPPLPSIGKPIANTRIYILNEQRQPVAAGEPGELFIGGVCLARGYLNRPELTAEKFVPDPFADEVDARMYRTGDLARFASDGNIEFLGRIDHQVKIRGFRIELGEIETLLSQHPGVREAVAVARETESGDKQLVAYVVAKNGPVAATDLRQFLKEHVPPYAIPSAFVPMAKFPLSPNGKVDRRVLPAVEQSEVQVDKNVKAPENIVQRQLQMVFERFFRNKSIGVDVSFFELGGDSLQALKLVLEIERVMGRKIPLNLLYQSPTIEALAGVLHKQAVNSQFSSLVPLQPSGAKRPLFLVHTTPGDVLGYGNLIHHLPPDRPCYAFQSVGLHRVESAHTRLEEMASHYVQLLLEQQTEGPYLLGGWCYGGILAVEMAHQLLAAGKTVAPLLLIETPAPAPPLTNSLYYLRKIGCLLNMTPRQWSSYVGQKINFYNKHRQDLEMRFKDAAKSDPAADGGQNEFIAQLEKVYHLNLTALNHYEPRRYPGKVILFNAAEPDPGLVPDPLYGWVGLAETIEARVIPGGHDTILMEPHVRTLSQQICTCLNAENV